jgi:hypothetical protein
MFWLGGGGGGGPIPTTTKIVAFFTLSRDISSPVPLCFRPQFCEYNFGQAII